MTKVLRSGAEPPKVKLVTEVWGPIQSLMAAQYSKPRPDNVHSRRCDM
jgi:hypothetical protein